MWVDHIITKKTQKKHKFTITIYSDFFAFFITKIYLCYKFYTHLIWMC